MGRKTRKLKSRYTGGGSNLRFTYTKNSGRVKWVEKLNPYGYQLMKKISDIPWDTYKYEGVTTLSIPIDPDGNEFRDEDISGVAILPKPAYLILGGAACEVLEHKYSKHIRLDNYVDPTADIDIILTKPLFKPNLDIDAYGTLLYKDDKYSDLADHYTRWLFDIVVKIMEDFNIKNTKKAEKENTHETEISDLNKLVGNFLISRLYRDNMIKIQVTTKVGDDVDHLLEFILSTVNQKTEYDETPRKYLLIDNIYIRSLYDLLLNQLEAYVNRKKGYNTNNEKNLVYKVYNHCGRVLYLAKLIQYLHSTDKNEKKILEKNITMSILFRIINKNKDTFKSEFCDKIHKDFYKTFIESFSEFPSYKIFLNQYKLL